MKEDKNVKRGCVDCAESHTDAKKEPCKTCVRWSKWEVKEKKEV